jgi:hypothetical protein
MLARRRDHYICSSSLRDPLLPPEVGAAQTRIVELAQQVSADGLDVTVLTGFPNYPDGVIHPTYRGRRFLIERVGDMCVMCTALYPAPNRGVARRLRNHTSFALSAMASSHRAGPADEAEAGIVCPPQPQAPAEAIAGLTTDPGGARALGLNGRRYVEANFTRRVAVERIERALHSMLGA